MNHLFSTMKIDEFVRRALQNNGSISLEKKLRVIAMLHKGGGKFLTGGLEYHGTTRFPDAQAAYREFKSFDFPEGSKIGVAPIVLSEDEAALVNEALKLSLKPGICLAFWVERVDYNPARDLN